MLYLEIEFWTVFSVTHLNASRTHENWLWTQYFQKWRVRGLIKFSCHLQDSVFNLIFHTFLTVRKIKHLRHYLNWRELTIAEGIKLNTQFTFLGESGIYNGALTSKWTIMRLLCQGVKLYVPLALHLRQHIFQWLIKHYKD